MINVAYELEGGIDEEAAARAVENVVRYHQQVLSGMTCPTHQKAPWLTVRGHSLPSLVVSVESCCQVLAKKVAGRLDFVSRRDQT